MFADAKLLQSCPTLCDPIASSPPGSPIPGILQARTLEWVAISLSNAWKWKVKVKLLSHVWLLVNPWTAAYQAPPSTGFSKQEYWCGVPLPSLNSVTNYPGLVQTSPVNGSVSHNSPHFRCHWQVPGATYTPVCRLLLKGLPQPPLQGQQLSRVSHRTQRNTLFIIMGFFFLIKDKLRNS